MKLQQTEASQERGRTGYVDLVHHALQLLKQEGISTSKHTICLLAIA